MIFHCPHCKEPIDTAVTEHPMRVAIIQQLKVAGKASPKQVSLWLNESLPMLAYHFKVLLQRGTITEAGTQQVRGATEHFYALADA